MAFKLNIEKKEYKVCIAEFAGETEVLIDSAMTEDHRELAFFNGMPLTEDEKKKLIKKWTKTKWEKPNKKTVPQRVETTDWPEIARDRFIKTITNWGGFTEEKDGKEIPIPFTQDNLERLYNTQGELVNAVMAVFDSINDLNLKEDEDQKKD